VPGNNPQSAFGVINFPSTKTAIYKMESKKKKYGEIKKEIKDTGNS
jgi:hypothetical protein